MSRPVEAIVNLANIRSNFALVRKLAANSRIMAIVKANAYGHGAVPVATALAAADAFGVASLAEAVELREAGITQPVVLLGGVFDRDEMHDVVRYGLQIVVHSGEQFGHLLAAELREQIVVWLKIDTGMHRLGFEVQDFAEIRRMLEITGKVKELVLMSHFGCADDVGNTATGHQLAVFENAVAGLPGEKSLANSAAVLAYPQTHYDWVRPGIMLYGANPMLRPLQAHEVLAPAMTLRSRLVAIHNIAAGEAVGYGEQWRSQRPARIGTVAIGYGDGYPRHAPNGTPMLIGGQRAGLVGRVSMDFITVDLTDIPSAAPGDEVILWGDGLPVEEVAKMAGSISYQLLTGVQKRVRRCYLF